MMIPARERSAILRENSDLLPARQSRRDSPVQWFDPPFVVLAMIGSVEAIFLSAFVLIR
jgi:hypothetical protein